MSGVYESENADHIIERGAEIYINNYNKSFVHPSSSCQSTSCASILVRNSNFSSFNHLKDTQTRHNSVSFTSNMRHYGIIFDLKQYRGVVAIKNNTFNSISMKYQTCALSESQSPHYLFGDSDVTQNKVLMYFRTYQDVELVENKFIS